HLVHTFRLSSSSFFQMIWRQPSHLTQRPSVRTRFSSVAWISLDSRLNHAKITHLSNRNAPGLKPLLITLPNAALKGRFPPKSRLIFNTPLGHHAFFIGVLYLLHFGYGIGQLNDCRMRVPSRQDYVYLRRFLL